MRLKHRCNWIGAGVILMICIIFPTVCPGVLAAPAAEVLQEKKEDFADQKNMAVSKIHWYSYEEGIGRGKREGKKIFLNFYADWCHYCQVMEAQTFQNSAVASYLNDHFVPIQINSDKQIKIVKKYEVEGLPTTFFLSENGETIGAQPGFIPPDIMLPLLKYIDTNSYQKMDFNKFQESP